MRTTPRALVGFVHRCRGDDSLKPTACGPGPPSGGPGPRFLAPALQSPSVDPNLARNHVDRCALRRQQPRHRSVLECLSVSSQVRPSSPPPGLWIYGDDNYSDAGGVYRLDEKLALIARQPLIGRARDELAVDIRSFVWVLRHLLCAHRGRHRCGEGAPQRSRHRFVLRGRVRRAALAEGPVIVAADVNPPLFAGEVADLFAGMDLRCCGHGPMTSGPACRP